MRHQWDLAERARVGPGLRMARAHVELDWEGQFKAAINPTRARQIGHRRDVETDVCTMCSELCAIRLAKEAMERKKVMDNLGEIGLSRLLYLRQPKCFVYLPRSVCASISRTILFLNRKNGPISSFKFWSRKIN